MAGSVVSPHYDPMLAKAIAHAGSRSEAALRLARSLRELEVVGVTTNRDALVASLESKTFLDGEVSTGFFDDHPEILAASAPSDVVSHAAVAAALVLRHRDRPTGVLRDVAPPGWRNVPSGPVTTTFLAGDGTQLTVRFRSGDTTNGTVLNATSDQSFAVVMVDDNAATSILEGVHRNFTITSTDEEHWVKGGGWQIRLIEELRFPASGADVTVAGPSAPLPGSVVSVEVEPNQLVREGDLLVVIEAMKMEHHILADTKGRVTAVLVAVGDRVDAHQVVVSVESQGS
jgi:acetyl/propionyl-CoA carboxylase alpha subunit